MRSSIRNLSIRSLTLLFTWATCMGALKISSPVTTSTDVFVWSEGRGLTPWSPKVAPALAETLFERGVSYDDYHGIAKGAPSTKPASTKNEIGEENVEAMCSHHCYTKEHAEVAWKDHKCKWTNCAACDECSPYGVLKPASTENDIGEENVDAMCSHSCYKTEHAEVAWEDHKCKWTNCAACDECSPYKAFDGEQQILLDTERKLAFCSIPKVASADFNILFTRLNNISKEDRGPHRFGAASPARVGVNLSDITRENGWKFGVFVRDPLKRFVSAFGSKCLPKPSGRPGGIHSCGGIVGQGPPDGWPVIDHPAPLDVMVHAFEEFVVHFKAKLHTKDDMLLTNNRHYMRQVDLIRACGSREFLPGRADVIGHLEDDVQLQVKNMLQLADKEGSLNIDKIAERHFPHDSVKAQHNAAEYTAENFLRNRTIKQMVIDMYKPDFSLGYALPKDGPANP